LLAQALQQLAGQDLAGPPGLIPGDPEAAPDGPEIDKNTKTDLSDGVGDAAWLTVSWAAQQPRMAGATGAELRAQPLGATLRLITPASPPPDDSSLAAFARSQGLDEQATRWLLSLPAQSQGAIVKGGGESFASQMMMQPTAPALEQVKPLVMVPMSSDDGSAPAQARVQPASQAIEQMQQKLKRPVTPLMELTVSQQVGISRTSPGLDSQLPDSTPTATVVMDDEAAAATPSAKVAAPAVAAVAAGLVPASLQLAGLMGGREREPVQAPPTDPSASASVIAGLRKTFLMPGVPAPARAAPGKAAPEAAAPSFVEAALDLEIDLPEALQGPDALDALQAWLDEVAPDDVSPTPSNTTTAPGETFTSRLGAVSPNALVDRSASVAAEALQRTEQHQALAQRMGEAMAQRLVAQVERGNWNVRFMLRPQSLGQVEVELQMRAGELEASFRAPQALTRELLSESLPRLREVLAQMGMDVAHLHVGARQGQSGGGNSTPRQNAPNSAQAASPEAAAGVSDSATRQSRGGLDGWDVLV
jgi:hypothetical protein